MSIPEKFAKPLEDAMALFGIVDKHDKAAFLANCWHETAGGKFMKELWGPTKWQKRYGVILGNHGPADGFKYRGRGFIQLTGRCNYHDMTRKVREVIPDAPDFEETPDVVAEPKWAAITSACWWVNHGCSGPGCRGEITNTRRIVNGKAMLGLAEVKKLYNTFLA